MIGLIVAALLICINSVGSLSDDLLAAYDQGYVKFRVMGQLVERSIVNDTPSENGVFDVAQTVYGDSGKLLLGGTLKNKDIARHYREPSVSLPWNSPASVSSVASFVRFKVPISIVRDFPSDINTVGGRFPDIPVTGFEPNKSLAIRGDFNGRRTNPRPLIGIISCASVPHCAPENPVSAEGSGQSGKNKKDGDPFSKGFFALGALALFGLSGKLISEGQKQLSVAMVVLAFPIFCIGAGLLFAIFGVTQTLLFG